MYLMKPEGYKIKLAVSIEQWVGSETRVAEKSVHL